jgi:hypothetical protein
MVLLLAVLSAAAASPPAVRAEQSARASITILTPHRATAHSWDPPSRPNQREMVKKEPDGRQVRLRLTEFE